MSKLTPKQKRFVEEYLVDLNAKQAAIRAEYSEKTAEQQGSRLLSNVKVQEAVTVAIEERSKENGLTVDMIWKGLLSEAKNYDEGASHSARVSAWAHLAKYKGMFIDRTSVTSLSVDIENLSDEQLERLASGEPIERVISAKG